MFDNELFCTLIRIITANAAGAGITNLAVKQGYQPTMQGANSAPAAYIYKISDKRLGYPHISDIWDEENEKMVHTETQQYETVFQISALSPQDPNQPDWYTASDTINLIAHILQSKTVVAELQSLGIGIYRVTNIRNTYFTNEKGQNEANPSFDFTLTHKQVIVSETPVIETTEYQIFSV